MYAVVALDGRQIRVQEGQELLVDYRTDTVGNELTFDQVVAIGTAGGDCTFGKPMVGGAKVTATVLSTELGPKLTIQKYRRRKNYKRLTGHRQSHTRIRITKISAPA